MRTLMIFLSFLLVIGPVALKGTSSMAAEYNLIFGGSEPQGTLMEKSNSLFVKLVNEKSRGRINIKYYPQLSDDVSEVQGTIAGTQHFYGDVQDWLANLEKDFNILAWAFTFRDKNHFAKFFASPEYQRITNGFEKKFNVKILGVCPTEPRIFYSKKPVFSLDDIKGKKMRVPEIEMYLKVWETLGAYPTRVTWSEVYMALRQGVIDCCEGPVCCSYGQKFHEAAPYVLVTNHLISTYFLLANGKAYENLPVDLRKVVDDAAHDSIEWCNSQSDKMERDTYDKILVEGAKLITIDMTSWRERIKAASTKMEQDGYWSKGLYDKIQQIK